MPSTIQYGVRDGRLVTLSDVQRGETALMCYTCGDRIVVKDGGGSSWMGRDAATVARPSTSRTRQKPLPRRRTGPLPTEGRALRFDQPVAGNGPGRTQHAWLHPVPLPR